MAKKPTYEELEDRVKKLEEEGLKRKGIEEALQKSKEKYTCLFDATPTPAMVIDKTGEIVEINSAHVEQVGGGKVKKENYLGLNLLKHPSIVKAGVDNLYREALNGKYIEAEDVYYPSVTRGTEGYFNVKVMPLFDENGEVNLVIATHDEITERKRAEDALRESEERFRALFESTTSCVLILEDRIMKYVNQATLNTFGYTKEEMIGKDTSLVYTSQESFEKIGRIAYKTIQEQGYWHEEVPFKKKDGKIIWMLAYLAELPKDGIVVILQDITERKQAEEALKESEERFRETVEILPSAIIEFGLDGTLTFVNSHGYKLSGYELKDVEEGLNVLRLIAPEDQNKYYERFQRVMKGEKLPLTEYRLLRKNGSTFWGLATSSLIRKNGKVVGIRTCIIDISKRKEAEDALKKRTVDLEKKTKSLEDLNTAMKVLLEKRKEDKTNLEESVMTNVNELIIPYFDKIKATKLDEQQKALLSIIESNMNEIISPFTRKLSLKYVKLTPTEIKIANMVKHGVTTKEIAKTLNISPRTVDAHRKNIRTKIGLKKKRANLRSHLLAMH